MSEAERSTGGLTRRSFLATTALGASAVAAGSLTACASQVDESTRDELAQTGEEGEKYFQSCMGNCSSCGCPFWVHVREGKIVNITKPDLTLPDGSKNPYQEICVKGYTNIERMYSDHRIKYPMRRVEGTKRGEGEWERISWDEAVAEITAKWNELQQKYGRESIAFIGGSGNSNNSVFYTGRLAALMGATSCASTYDMTGMMSNWTRMGFVQLTNSQNEYRDMLNSDNIFIWGANPTESMIVDYHLVAEAKEKGAKIIVIDPIFTTAASKADMFVPIRPGTDGLLAAGMAQIAMRDGFMDKKNLQTNTVGPFLVKESDGLYLRLSDLGGAEAGSEDDRILVYEGSNAIPFDEAQDPEVEGAFEVNGIAVKPAAQVLIDRINEWDLETISEYTDIPVATIEELAAIYTSGLSMIFTGFGLDHYANGQTAYEGMFALLDITGQECKHGAGITVADFSAPTAVGNLNLPTADLTDVMPGPTVYSSHFPQLVETGECGDIKADIKGLYVYNGNPIGNLPERQRWVSAFEAMELVVVADIFMSESATYADYVLPVAFLFERSDMIAGQSLFLKLTEKAVEPSFEAKPDFDIVTLLGKAMGFEDRFTLTLDEYLEGCVSNDVATAAGVTWERLKEEHAVFSYPEEPVVVGVNEFPLTATGRLEFYHEGILPMANAGQEFDQRKESCWFWEPPLEAWHENEKFSQYPLIFISERCKFKTHTMFNHVSSLQELDPEPFVKLSPKDAEARGIAEGDTVRLFNDRGYVVLKAVINNGCRPGVIVIDHGWEKDAFIEGHYSDLTSIETWPRYEGSNYFDCLCEMEKAQ
ncbi:molybdopterin-dependent oxidoreductase [Adlercreutzia sp. R21]|uniref:molybdopterin-containing oxidoreductase family protein n=1 Tax=Adlercreutzia wanghongyangiae TaxID=3111451 RepID=UPI002DBBF3F6|nr:molybdopterin-dependent oxidoreductase [Adlercreutzia sp. R21]MEC4184772.1 molybdopterin-dependent oxidoreductase [Adlercreutzia sp. R21]